MGETDKVRERYARREQSPEQSSFVRFAVAERESIYKRVLREKFGDVSKLSMIEIGAGSGTNIPFFHDLGIPWENIYANELLDDRAAKLKENLPHVKLHAGDALALEYSNKFDIVFQSTVFTSILDKDFKRRLAEKMVEMARPGGIVLWYDFRYDNPRNKDVKGIPVAEIEELFAGKKIDLYPVTLAPPIGRRVGGLYRFINTLFPFLRTHVIAVIHIDRK